MPTTGLGTVLQDLRRSAVRLEEAGRADGDLLEGFIARRDECAFETLLRRHGPMVLGVCRRVLGNEADAEDAFQATFLVLVRKAPSIRPRGMVGNWLYGVAHATALKARAMNSKRVQKEREAAVRAKPDDAARTQEPLYALLAQELGALPERYRAAIVLCDLEGKTIKEAARQLGCPPGTVGTRLARARALLSRRLARRGLALSGGTIGAVIAQSTATAGVPPLLMSSTFKAVTLFAAGQAAAAGLISVKVAALTEGVLKTMFLTKLKIATAAVLVILLASVGVGVGVLPQKALVAGQLQATEKQDAKKDDKAEKKDVKEADKAEADRKKMEGRWMMVKLPGDQATLGKLKRGDIIITKDKLTTADEKVYTITLYPDKDPKAIDVVFPGREKEKQQTMQGIYAFEGDDLKICLAPPGVKRPDEFKTKEASNTVLYYFKH